MSGGRASDRVIAVPSEIERAGEHVRVGASEGVDLPRIEVLEHDLGGAEEVRVDLIEVVVVPGEDGGERLAVVARGAGGYLGADCLEAGIVAGHGEDDTGSVKDGVVRPADRGQIVGGHRRKWGRALRRDESRQ